MDGEAEVGKREPRVGGSDGPVAADAADGLWQRHIDPLPSGGGRSVEPVEIEEEIEMEAEAAVDAPPVAHRQTHTARLGGGSSGGGSGKGGVGTGSGDGAGSGGVGLLTTLLGASPVDADGNPKRRPRYIHTKWLQTSERWLGVFENGAFDLASSRVYAGKSCTAPAPTVSNVHREEVAVGPVAWGAGTRARACGAGDAERVTDHGGVGARALAALEEQWNALDRGDKITTTAPVAGTAEASAPLPFGIAPPISSVPPARQGGNPAATAAAATAAAAAFDIPTTGVSPRVRTPAVGGARRTTVLGRGGSIGGASISGGSGGGTFGGSQHSPMPPPPSRNVTLSASQPELRGISGGGRGGGGARSIGVTPAKASSQPVPGLGASGKPAGRNTGKIPGAGRKKRRREEGFL